MISRRGEAVVRGHYMKIVGRKRRNKRKISVSKGKCTIKEGNVETPQQLVAGGGTQAPTAVEQQGSQQCETL